MEIPDAEAFLQAEGCEYVRFEQPDLHGMSRSKTVPAAHFRHYAEQGLNFLGGLIYFFVGRPRKTAAAI